MAMKEIVDSLNMSIPNDNPIRIITLTPFPHKKEYWEYIDLGFDNAFADFKEHNIIIDKMYFNQFDVESFVAVTNDIVTLKPNAVVLAPVFRDETMEFLHELNEANIPFSFVDSMIPDTNFLTYFGQNSFQSGYLAAKILIDGKIDKSKILVICTQRDGSESNQTITRHNGFMQYIKDNFLTDTIELLNLELLEDNESYNISAIEKILANNPDIKGAVTFNSKMYRIASCVKSNMRLVGYDTLPENLRFLRMGVIYSLIAQHPEKQSYLSIRALYRKLVLNQDVVKINYLPIDVLFRENIEDYMNFLDIES